MKYLISKSSYIRGIQCLKSVYLYKNHYRQRDPLPEARKIRFAAGHDIGLMARRIFPGGIDASPLHPGNYTPSILKTTSLISKFETVIYEAAFSYNRVLAALDILIYNDGWYAYEVKSSEKISNTYLEDAALQYYVITGNGITLKDFGIIHLKKHYNEINGSEPVEEIFRFTSVLEECLTRQSIVRTRIEEIKYILASGTAPSVEIGEHCNDPYTCDFIGWCTKQKEQIKEGLFS